MIEHLSEYLLIKPNGRVFFMNGGFTKKTVEKDVTDCVTRFLPLQCRFAPDATFRDLLLIVQRDLEFFETLVGLHCREFVEEGLSQVIPGEPGCFLELYWRSDDSMGVVEGLDFPSFHEIVGEDDSRALGFVPTYQFASLPVKLKHDACLYLWKDNIKSAKCEEHHFKLGFTLYQVLYGIFWELSFYAHPSNREQRTKEILGEDINETTET